MKKIKSWSNLNSHTYSRWLIFKKLKNNLFLLAMEFNEILIRIKSFKNFEVFLVNFQEMGTHPFLVGDESFYSFRSIPIFNKSHICFARQFVRSCACGQIFRSLIAWFSTFLSKFLAMNINFVKGNQNNYSHNFDLIILISANKVPM